MIALGLLLVVLTLLFYYLLRANSYWAKKGIPQTKDPSIYGTVVKTILQVKPNAELSRDRYQEFKKHRYYGVEEFGIKMLLIKDLELIKQIGVKDFDHFSDHTPFVEAEDDPLWAKNLFNLQGEDWRRMRSILSPSFTGSRMKLMLNMMNECGDRFVNYFQSNSEHCSKVDMSQVFTRITTDLIGTVAFGIKCDSLADKNNEFYTIGVSAVDFNSVLKNIQFFVIAISTKLAKLLNFKIFSDKVYKFFTSLIAETIKTREEKNITRPDMLQLLIEARKREESADASKDEGVIKSTLTIEDITAQALIFFLGGLDTVSNMLMFLSYELAVNPDIQERLLKEIDDALDECDGNLTYEVLMNMKYLDMTISETLRMYPTFIEIERLCTKSYTIQPKNQDEKEVQIVKGDSVGFPVYAIHYDEDYFPNPGKFDPERFSEENKSKIEPYSYLPFGVGPRNCLASRFALMESKILIIKLLSKFELLPTTKTPIPMRFKKGTFGISPEKPVILDFNPRTK